MPVPIPVQAAPTTRSQSHKQPLPPPSSTTNPKPRSTPPFNPTSSTSPNSTSNNRPIAGPSSLRNVTPIHNATEGGSDSSPVSMQGISFTDGGGFQFAGPSHTTGASGVSMSKSIRSSGNNNQSIGAGSYGARFYGGALDSPSHPFATSVTMDSSSFSTSSAAFNLPPPLSTSSSFRGGRSYAAAARGSKDMSSSASVSGYPQPGSSSHWRISPSMNPQYHFNNTPNSNPNALSTSFASMSFQPMSISFGNGSYSKSQVHSLMAKNRLSSGGGVRSDAELTETYECCGVIRNGLHDLLEHVEDSHPFTDQDMGINLEPSSFNINNINGPGFSPQVLAMDMDLDSDPPSKEGDRPGLGTVEERVSLTGSIRSRSSNSPTTSGGLPSYPVPTPNSSKPTTPNEGPISSPLPLQISDVLNSPFAESILASSANSMAATNSKGGINNGNGSGPSVASTCSSPPEGSLATPTTSQHPSPVFTVPKVGPIIASRGFLGNQTAASRPKQRFDRAFNEVVAGSTIKDKLQPLDILKANKSPKHSSLSSPSSTVPEITTPNAIAPGVLFANAVGALGIPTGPPGQQQQQTETNGEKGPIIGNGNDQLPQPSLFSLNRPWRCPNPGCNKSYKQSNGLKYHQQRGQCDFAVNEIADAGLTTEEADAKYRPYVCAVGAGCTKRYRQMNGLKYHYLNSGDHGQYGLRMIQNGTHPQPVGVPPITHHETPKPSTLLSSTSNTTPKPSGLPSNPVSNGSMVTPTKRPIGAPASSVSSFTPRANTAPYHIPSQIGATRPVSSTGPSGPPKMGVFPPLTKVGGISQARPGNGPGLANVGKMGVPVKSNTLPLANGVTSNNGLNSLNNGIKRQPQPLPVQRGRDAVLFAAVDTMDL